jgi:ubiquinone biosynthesis monooxygenase Coq7
MSENSNARAGLFGDPSPAEVIERMVRVDQAGEYGAVRIYQGQMAVLGRRKSCGETLRHMSEQERRHLETFNRIVADRRVRPTLLEPLWHLAGYALGAGTALLGERAAMACTVAVEEVIEEHYAAQAAALGDDEADLRGTILRFRDEELAHRETALSLGAAESPGYGLLSAAIKAGTRVAIKLSERL